MNYLVLLRHGQSEWNAKNLFTGWQDPALTKKGADQARMAGYALKQEGIVPDQVFTSDLRRAQHTAGLALEAMETDSLRGEGPYGYSMHVHPALKERGYGVLEGLNKAEIAAQYGDVQVKIWRRSYDTAPPDGESLRDVMERVTPCLQKHILPLVTAGNSILVVAHGNSLRATLVFLGLYTPEQIALVEIDTGMPKIIAYENGVMKDAAPYDLQAFPQKTLIR